MHQVASCALKVVELALLKVVEMEQFELLRRLLGTEHVNKYVHAKSYITTGELADSQVTTGCLAIIVFLRLPTFFGQS